MNKKLFAILLLCVTGFLCIRQDSWYNETVSPDADDDYDDYDDDDGDWDDNEDNGDMMDWDSNLNVSESMRMNFTEYNTTGLTINLQYDNRLGNFLSGENGLSLYYFSKDHIGSGFTEQDFNITCYDECARNWPPVLITNENMEIIYGMGVNSNLLTTRLRDDGTTQLTYNNIPLYYFARDRILGDTYGHGIYDHDGYWYLINSEGLPIKN
jgi:predicted lipoprotein with Yx(FWY)xxD motif